MADARRHHAVQVIFVETPSAGSPKSTRGVKPGNYPRQDRTPWRYGEAWKIDAQAWGRTM
jgi:hypothetical protein